MENGKTVTALQTKAYAGARQTEQGRQNKANRTRQTEQGNRIHKKEKGGTDMSVITGLEKRRSRYLLNKELPVAKEKVEEVIKE
ncbi:hypothetical protein [Suipraeoptans intestinalis]|uniref:hypothetical protein n=1 Tax=Suipraeoptans intestinalis TaxID=2606628 RepID=UPI002ED37FFE